MLAKTYSAITLGLTPQLIEVEVDGVRGTPKLVFIGLPSRAVDEAKERITSALLNCSIRIKSKRTVVNLAPVDLKKTGSQFELAIAVGILQMYGEVSYDTSQTIFLGELSLDGTVKPIKGALSLALAAEQMGFKQAVLPAENVSEVVFARQIKVIPVSHLQQLINQGKTWQLQPVPVDYTMPKTTLNSFRVFPSIIGQTQAKRALQIAAAGAHNLLLVGPPGAGKSLLSQAVVELLPPLSEPEMIEVTQVHSISDDHQSGIITTRPFRNPHHSISQAGLIGGGSQVKPGEISLAHRGVLFLDELPEFSRKSLESLRQPLEDGTVIISRAAGSYSFPTKFTLIAAANPCPCGFATDPHRSCSCSPRIRQLYQQKISGPLLDRIDLQVKVDPVLPSNLTASLSSQTSIDTPDLNLISVVRQQKLARAHDFESVVSSSAQSLLKQAVTKFHLSARSYFQLLKVSQTIADLDQDQIVQDHHIAEALTYRHTNWS